MEERCSPVEGQMLYQRQQVATRCSLKVFVFVIVFVFVFVFVFVVVIRCGGEV